MSYRISFHIPFVMYISKNIFGYRMLVRFDGPASVYRNKNKKWFVFGYLHSMDGNPTELLDIEGNLKIRNWHYSNNNVTLKFLNWCYVRSIDPQDIDPEEFLIFITEHC